MTQTLKAKFEGGTFRPVEAVLPAFSEGQDVMLTVEAEQKSTENKPFIFGLHAGMGWMSDDFDEELPDSFWLGEE